MKTDKQTGEFILYVVIAIVVLVVVYKLFLKKSVTEQSTEKSDEAVTDYIKEATSTQTPSRTRGELALIAETVYNDLKYSRIDDNHGDAIYQLARMRNDADVAVLIELFGKRQEYAFGLPLGDEQNLAQFVRGNLNPSEIDIVNDNYRRKSIKFRW